ncbi:MAG: hypothetical protein ACYCWC_02690 [Rhodocyclaceae bacterium]
MGRRFLTLLLAFAAMVVGIEGLRRAVDWWNAVAVLGGDTAGAVPPAPTFIDSVLIACLPLIGWLWWRYLSPFRRECACQRPLSPAVPATADGSPERPSRESRDKAPRSR